ncbi:NADH-quinone oxidoreductase subunit N [Candidatus Colwellia aromaticivorans]|uniref:NADH-quinone oxidoreductase subunit N n=1 Tax=Candidatus Colwellia aromaticivorans TaxID=2267621 RepID=UPI000DF22146|nr:NADH-quinone oxidoreductase subunit N [Candidatus Colwellia aromaticivorans]
MTQLMLHSLLPVLIVAFGIVLSLLLIAWRRSQKLILIFTITIFSVALLASFSLFVDLADAVQVTTLVKVDSYGLFAFMLVLVASIAVSVLSSMWLTHTTEVHDEFFVLLQLVVLGAGILVISDHYASLFLGFELLSIALVGLVGYSRDSEFSVETSFKYLVLSACASSFMLLGIAFIYSYSGSLSFSTEQLMFDNMSDLSILVRNYGHGDVLFYRVGFLLFMVGIAFKLSLAPFHLWTPDVYQGAPTPVTLLLATVSKIAIFIVLMKCWFSQAIFVDTKSSDENMLFLMSIFAIASMLIGNALALKQQNIKRLLAYSSIAHMGYLLIVLIVISPQSVALAWQSALFYLTAYVLASISIFMTVQLTQYHHNKSELNVDDWQGMFWQNPSLAVLIIVAILSLAGIPLTMGFIGKFYLLNVAVQAQQWWLISALIIGSGIGLFYYLRIIFVLFTIVNEKNIAKELIPVSLTLSPAVNFSVMIVIILSVLLGIFPDLLGNLLVTVN